MSGAKLYRLLPLTRSQWPRLALGTLALLIGSVTTLAYPKAIAMVVDAVASNNATERAGFHDAMVLFTAAFVVQAACAGLRTWLFASASERMVVELKQRLLRTMLRQPITFFDRRKTGELLNRLGQDCAQVKAASTVLLGNALQLVLSVVGALALLVLLSPHLALSALPTVPVLTLLAAWQGNRLRSVSRAIQDALALSNVVAEEAISSIRTVRAFAREEHEVARYTGGVRVFSELAERRARLSGTFTSVTACVGFGAMGFMLWQGASMVESGALSLGDFTAFLAYAIIIATSLPPLTSVYANLMNALGASDRVFEILELAVPDSSSAPSDSTRGVARVSFERISFHYPTRPGAPVLDEFSLEIAPGESVALVGRFGVGKSTIAALLTGLYTPTAGRLSLDGVDIRELGAKTLSARVSIVSQEPVLFSASILENIRYGRLDASAREIREVARLANALPFIESLPAGFDTQVGQRGVCLSGGQRQAIAIARALLKDPDVLILDEPTSALDAGSEALVRLALERLMVGRTTLVITHRLTTLRLAERVCLLERGRIVASGTHDELVARSAVYREVLDERFNKEDPQACSPPRFADVSASLA